MEIHRIKLRFIDETGDYFDATPIEAAKHLGLRVTDLDLECAEAQMNGVADIPAQPGMSVARIQNG